MTEESLCNRLFLKCSSPRGDAQDSGTSGTEVLVLAWVTTSMYNHSREGITMVYYAYKMEPRHRECRAAFAPFRWWNEGRAAPGPTGTGRGRRACGPALTESGTKRRGDHWHVTYGTRSGVRAIHNPTATRQEAAASESPDDVSE